MKDQAFSRWWSVINSHLPLWRLWFLSSSVGDRVLESERFRLEKGFQSCWLVIALMNNITKCNEFYNNSQHILQSVCHEISSHQGQNMILCQGPVFSVVTNRVVNIRPSICEGRRSTPRGAALVLVSALSFYCFGNDTCSAFFVGN